MWGREWGDRHRVWSWGETLSSLCYLLTGLPGEQRGEGLAGLWDEDELEFGLAPVLCEVPSGGGHLRVLRKTRAGPD